MDKQRVSLGGLLVLTVALAPLDVLVVRVVADVVTSILIHGNLMALLNQSSLNIAQLERGLKAFL